MAEPINFEKFKLGKQQSETERLKSLLKRAFGSEPAPQKLKNKLSKMIRKK